MKTFYQEIQKIEFFAQTFWNNSMLDYTVATGLFFLIYFALKVLTVSVLKVAKKNVKKTNTTKDNLLIKYFERKKQKTFVPIEMFLALYFSLKFLNYSQTVANLINTFAIVLCTIFVVLIIIDVIKYLIETKYKTNSENNPQVNSFNLLFPIIKIIIWILSLFFVLSNLGFNVSSLLAGLGIGGIAIALASQSFLSDLLSFISIISDKPFEVGDYILVNGIEGTVTKIGIKSVRIERNMGEEVIIPNSKITQTDLHNFKKLNKRRADLILGIAIETSNEKLKLIPPIIKNICDENEKIEFIRCHFSSLLSHCYEFSAVYFVCANDFMTFADARQFVNLRVKEELDKHEIKLGYPTTEIKIREK